MIYSQPEVLVKKKLRHEDKLLESAKLHLERERDKLRLLNSELERTRGAVHQNQVIEDQTQLIESIVTQLNSDLREEEVDAELGKLLDVLDTSLRRRSDKRYLSSAFTIPSALNCYLLMHRISPGQLLLPEFNLPHRVHHFPPLLLDLVFRDHPHLGIVTQIKLAVH